MLSSICEDGVGDTNLTSRNRGWHSTPLQTINRIRYNQKNTMARLFGELFGEHYILVEDAKHLLGKFNAHLANKVIVFADESFWGGNKADEGLLKGLITNEKRILEHKGKNAIPVNDYTHLIMATNQTPP
jgi:Family of unknown function (DUF5906)